MVVCSAPNRNFVSLPLPSKYQALGNITEGMKDRKRAFKMLSSGNDTAITILQQLKLLPLDLRETGPNSQSWVREEPTVERWLLVGRPVVVFS